MAKPVFDFWNDGDKEHTFHFPEAWPNESKGSLQFFAYPEEVQGTEGVWDFWSKDGKDHSFGLDDGSCKGDKGSLHYWAFKDRAPGTVPIGRHYNKNDHDTTLHAGGPWPNEEGLGVAFYAFPADLQHWNQDASCEGSPAGDRMRWLQDNKGMSAEAASLQVMHEFPTAFGLSGPGGKEHFVDGEFPHTLSIVQDDAGKNRLRIVVRPRNPEEVSLVAVHYGVDHDECSMNFDLRDKEGGVFTHVTPDFGPECNPGSAVHYWLAAEVDGLIHEMPHGACPDPQARLHWRAE